MRQVHVTDVIAAALEGFRDSQALALRTCEFCGLTPSVVWESILIGGKPRLYRACQACADSCKDCGVNPGEKHLADCDLDPEKIAEAAACDEAEDERTAGFERGLVRGFNEAKEAR